tara:strand:+ start:256 stop:525 length:270 start_codon:yes stop_codon:yes gene_type:complete
MLLKQDNASKWRVLHQHQRVAVILLKQGKWCANMVDGVVVEVATFKEALSCVAGHRDWVAYLGPRPDNTYMSKYIPFREKLTKNRWSDS